MAIPYSKILKLIFVLDLLLVHAGLGYLVYKSTVTTVPQVAQKTDSPQIISTGVDVCGAECKAYIDAKILEQESGKVEVASSTPQIVYKAPAAAPKTKTRSVTYLTLSGSGSTTANDWTSLGGSDFYFNTSDYPGLIEVYFEANIKLFNGNGMAYVRLFDVTHGIAVQGSEVQTTSQASNLVTSGKVTFWAGKNLIRVQAKSLTADTAVFDSGRLRIVTEQ